MKKILFLFLLGGFSLYLASCADDDEATPVGGAITISGIPATATINEGETLEVTGVTLSAEDGIQSFTVSVNGGAAADLTADLGITVGDLTATGTITFPTTGLTGTQTLVFTLTDVDGDSETFTHVLVLGVVPATFTVLDATEERGPDEDNTTSYPQNEVTGVINEDFTFTNDVVWVLNGRVIVAGATLTIEPGTIIKGTTGGGATSSVLLVARDARIIADGTAAEPIVFTSVLDNINLDGLAYFDAVNDVIVPGTDPSADGFTSQGLDFVADIGLWGGLIVLGDAPISSGDGVETSIEGIPSSVAQAVYGGTNAEHDGGIIEYVSIRFTGTALAPGNELQGLTLGGVGSGTVVNFVESISSADDGTEIFGGTVNMSNFIVWGQEDDGYDTDQAWSGTVDNFLYLGTHPTADHALELDGPEGASTGIGNFVNGTLWGANSTGLADLRDDSEHSITNSFFFRFGASADLEIDDAEGSANYLTDGTITLTGLQFRENEVNTLEGIIDNTNGDDDAANTLFTSMASDNEVIGDAVAPTVGADLTDFGWSLTAQEFAGFGEIPSVTVQ